MRMTLSNGVQIEQIQRDGFSEIVCAGNPDRVLTSEEWNEAADLLVSHNRDRLAKEKADKHAASVAAFRQSTKTPGQIAYEEDVIRRPNYEDGTPRPTWDELGKLYNRNVLSAIQQSWERNPTPRNWNS